MLLPKKMSKKTAVPVYSLICALHGLAYGTLYAPVQAIMYNLNFKAMTAWIIAGLPWDAIHSAGNFALGFLIVPLSTVLIKFHRTAK